MLCEKAVLVTRPGAGIFVNSIPSYIIDSSQATIMVFLEWTIEQSGTFNLAFEGIRMRAVQEECSIRFSYLGIDKFNESEVQKLSGDADGIIMLAEYDRKKIDFSPRVPAVGVGWQNTASSVSVVDLDPFEAAELAVKYFQQTEAEEVMIISSSQPNKMVRAETFANAWTRAGGKADITTFDGTPQLEKVSIEPDKNYLFTSSWALERCSHIFQRKFGSELAQKSNILGIDGRNIFDPNGHKSASIYPNWREIGSRALQECLERIKSPGRQPARIYLPCSLHEEPLD